MAKSWLVDGRAIARKVKTSGLPSALQIQDCGANWECPQCSCRIDNSHFDPSDVELLEHLAAKCGVGNEKPHPYVDEFIPTLDVEEGICYEHPENLPGARKDGNSVHFFYRTTNAYTRGRRKRRKICNGSSLTTDVRWHKTGKTKAIFKNVVHIGYKKIMVLYQTSVEGSKPSKINWVMHQYHLGTDEDEKDGEYVVSKIFYHTKKQSPDKGSRVVELDASTTVTSPATPATPKADAPDPPRPLKSVLYEDKGGQLARVAGVVAKLIAKEGKSATLKLCSGEVEVSLVSKNCPATDEQAGNIGVNRKKWFELKDGVKLPAREDDLQAIDLDAFHNSFFGQDNADAYHPIPGSSFVTDDAVGAARDTSFETIDLENLDVGTPPEFDLTELYFSSQDSVFGGLDCL
ncbi:No apical meristem (NAM) protein [Cynara cardunculus var. scolymus]|uniref:No apical meristem (NAM) protein n=1 Tax=Cynara cardunculus var. scolymus TaxID=59895 RepID=A0A118K172_CYNCS|nr:No apical meristem (NAM) protein [Cynara cardunculus var. scolymus]